MTIDIEQIRDLCKEELIDYLCQKGYNINQGGDNGIRYDLSVLEEYTLANAKVLLENLEIRQDLVTTAFDIASFFATDKTEWRSMQGLIAFLEEELTMVEVLQVFYGVHDDLNNDIVTYAFYTPLDEHKGVLTTIWRHNSDNQADYMQFRAIQEYLEKSVDL